MSRDTSRLRRCVNFDRCSLADAGDPIEVAPGRDFVCPECRRALGVLPSKGPLAAVSVATLPTWAKAAGAGVVLLGGALVVYSMLPASQKAGETAAAEGGKSSGGWFGGGEKPALSLAGSNTIGDKLAPALAEGWMKSKGCTDVEKSSPGKDETILRCTLDGKPMTVAISAHGTKTGFAGLADGTANLAMASDRIDSETVAKLADLGDMTTPAAEHVVGFDGVAVIVNKANKVEQLTLAQVSNLFSGAMTDWTQVGGTPGPVRVYARDDKSGTWKFFERTVLKANGAKLTDTAKRFEKGSELADGVVADPGGIGFVGAASAEVSKVVPILAEQGGTPLEPTTLTIRTGDYILSRQLYMYVAPKRISSETAQFLAFIDSPPGDEIIKKSGFTPLGFQAIKQAAPTNAPSAYAAVTSGAQRLNFVFTFKTGSSELDNLATRDLKRLANYLADKNISADRVTLIGFTDNKGSPVTNTALSVSRARTVAGLLERTGVRVGSSTGFGPALPVAPNSTDEGRNRNRRVEVWVK